MSTLNSQCVIYAQLNIFQPVFGEIFVWWCVYFCSVGVCVYQSTKQDETRADLQESATLQTQLDGNGENNDFTEVHRCSFHLDDKSITVDNIVNIKLIIECCLLSYFNADNNENDNLIINDDVEKSRQSMALKRGFCVAPFNKLKTYYLSILS